MATTTITALTAVIAADLDATALFVVDDANGNTRKATLAQLITAILGGNVAVGGTLGVTGLTTLTGNLRVNVIDERTAAAGVTIETVLVKDGLVDGVDVSAFKSAYDSHNHDGRYYTESEVDALLAGKSGTSHTHTFASLTSKPTTLSGFGITDAVPLAGGVTMTGDLIFAQRESPVGTYNSAQVTPIWAMGTAYVATNDLGAGLYGLARSYQSVGGFPAWTGHGVGYYAGGTLAALIAQNGIYTTGRVMGSYFEENSSEETKDEIEPWTGNAESIIRETEIVTFLRKSDKGTEIGGHTFPTRFLGTVAERTNPLLSGPERKKFIVGNAAALALAGLQEVFARLDVLEAAHA